MPVVSPLSCISTFCSSDPTMRQQWQTAGRARQARSRCNGNIAITVQRLINRRRAFRQSALISATMASRPITAPRVSALDPERPHEHSKHQDNLSFHLFRYAVNVGVPVVPGPAPSRSQCRHHRPVNLFSRCPGTCDLSADTRNTRTYPAEVIFTVQPWQTRVGL